MNLRVLFNPSPKEGLQALCLMRRSREAASHPSAGQTFFRAMKITAMIMFLACLQVSATGYAQLISLSEKNVPLPKVFKEIERQSGYDFLYTYELVEQMGNVSIKVKNVSLQQALEECLKGKSLEYTLVDKTVVIKKKERIPASEPSNKLTPPDDITGVITTNDGEPLMGANIVIKRTRKGTQTDASGVFTIKDVQPGDTLVISFIGYQSKSLRLGPKVGDVIALLPSKAGDVLTQIPGDFILISLELTDNQLDEAVVRGYGTTTQRTITGNIATITSKQIATQPVMNPLMALQGRVAGLVITPTSGYTNGRARVELRGRNFLGTEFTSDPLYIIDGVPLTVLNVGNVGGTVSSSYLGGSAGFDQGGFLPGGLNALSGLNPADIERIEVLKDADATAIYGSRGASGVILITTKKGKAGKTNLEVSITKGYSEVSRHWQMLNTPQYLQMRREAFKNDGLIPTVANAPDLMQWDTTRYTDWQKELWGGIGKYTDVQAALSGGDQRTNFRLSANYQQQTEILTSSGGNQRAGVSFNVNHTTQDQRLLVSFTTNYSYNKVDAISVPGSVTLPPNAPAIYDSLGNLNWRGWQLAPGTQGAVSYPFAPLLRPATTQSNFLISNLRFSYQVLKGFNLVASLGYNTQQGKQSQRRPIASLDPRLNPRGSARFGTNQNNNWIFEPQATYSHFVGKGKLDVLLGGSAQSTSTNALSVIGEGYTNDALLRSVSSAVTSISTESDAQYKYAAVFGRISYNWEDKYILNLNARRDGSSRFGADQRFGNFGSVGLAWVASQEKWLKQWLPAQISFVKLRASYGTTGSDAVQDYKYLSQWGSTNAQTRALLPYDGVAALQAQQHVNPRFQWQENRKLEGALSLGFLNDRITLDVAWYRNRCDNQLTDIPLPSYTGFTTVTSNWEASVENSGWEFVTAASLLRTTHFSWLVNANLAINRNKLLAYPNIEKSTYTNQYLVGQSLNNEYVFHYTGVDPETGQYSFEDRNGDGIITGQGAALLGSATDDRVGYNLSPKWTAGLGNELRYKNLSLNFFFTLVNQIGRNSLIGVPTGAFNMPTEMFENRWQKPGDVTDVGRLTSSFLTSRLNYATSDALYTDASYVRLQNLALSYSLPTKLVRKAGMQGCRVFMNAQNVLTFTRYQGIDPTIQSFGGLPSAKVFTGGISFNF